MKKGVVRLISDLDLFSKSYPNSCKEVKANLKWLRSDTAFTTFENNHYIIHVFNKEKAEESIKHVCDDYGIECEDTKTNSSTNKNI